MVSKNKDELIKKLIYQSLNRGCKETDLIIGKFASQNLHKMTDNELQIFASILSFNDADIYAWYTGKEPVPEQNRSAIMTQILNFDPNK